MSCALFPMLWLPGSEAPGSEGRGAEGGGSLKVDQCVLGEMSSVTDQKRPHSERANCGRREYTDDSKPDPTSAGTTNRATGECSGPVTDPQHDILQRGLSACWDAFQVSSLLFSKQNMRQQWVRNGLLQNGSCVPWNCPEMGRHHSKRDRILPWPRSSRPKSRNGSHPLAEAGLHNGSMVVTVCLIHGGL